MVSEYFNKVIAMKKVLLLIILLSISAVSVCASVIKYISTDGKIIVPNNEFYDSNGLLLTIKSNTMMKVWDL